MIVLNSAGQPADGPASEEVLMRLGFVLPLIGSWAGPEGLTRVATRAEELGLDSVWVTDRSLFPTDPQTPYPGGPLAEVYKWALDPLDVLTFVAGQTTRIGLGSSIINLLWYQPVLLARRLTTIDVLSNGRLQVGLGQGWSKDEYDVAGTPWTNRGKRFDEALEALFTIWSDDPVEFHGEFYEIPRSHISIKPVQKPHPPVYLAAYTPAAQARVARYTDGWHPTGIPLDYLPETFASIKAQADAAGRNGSALELVVRANGGLTEEPLGEDRSEFWGTPEQIGADIAKARDIGTDELLFDFTFDPAISGIDDFVERLELVARVGKEATADVSA
jgi:probable F420-dependent oxidoreductase